MAKFITISGPSSSGKTELFNQLDILSGIKTERDIFKSTWEDMIEGKVIAEFSDISRDQEYLAIYIQRLIYAYRNILKKYKNVDDIIVTDSGWIDILVYSQVNMWCVNLLKTLQTNLLTQILNIRDSFNGQVFITSFKEGLSSGKEYQLFRRYSIKHNHPLEIAYYDFYSGFKNVSKFESTNVFENSKMISDLIEKWRRESVVKKN